MIADKYNRYSSELKRRLLKIFDSEKKWLTECLKSFTECGIMLVFVKVSEFSL